MTDITPNDMPDTLPSDINKIEDENIVNNHQEDDLHDSLEENNLEENETTETNQDDDNLLNVVKEKDQGLVNTVQEKSKDFIDASQDKFEEVKEYIGKHRKND